jgi:hypothetical protein
MVNHPFVQQNNPGNQFLAPVNSKRIKPALRINNFYTNWGMQFGQILAGTKRKQRNKMMKCRKQVCEQKPNLDKLKYSETISTAKSIGHGLRQFNQFSQPERFLLQNAQFRRIWLRLDEPKNCNLN